MVSMFSGALATTLPVLLVLCIGMLLNKTQLIKRDGMEALKNLVVNITLPAVLLRSFATTTYSLSSLVIPLSIFVICLLAWLIGKGAAKLFKLPSPFIPFLTTGFEAGMLGYTLYEMLCGAEHTANFAIVDLGQVLFVFTAYKLLLAFTTQRAEDADIKKLLGDMLRSPIIIAILAGILIGASGLYTALIPCGVSGIFSSALEFVAAPTSVLILLVIGYDLDLRGIKWRAVSKTLALRLGIMLVLMAASVLLFDALLHISQEMKYALYVLFILPPPFVLPAFADDEAERGNISCVLSVYTVVSILCFFVLSVLIA